MFFGQDFHIRAHVDAQATIGFSHRVGFRKARLIETAEMSIKDAFKGQEIVRVGEHNLADVPTKPVT